MSNKEESFTVSNIVAMVELGEWDRTDICFEPPDDSSILWSFLVHLLASDQNLFLKIFLIIFPKKTCSEKAP